MRSVPVLLLAPLLFACGDASADRTPVPDASDTDVRPTMADIANATVSGIYDDPVTLTEGRYAGPPFESGGIVRPTVALGDRLIAWADVDGDGQEEAAALLEENSGGTGHFLYLGVFGADAGEIRSLGAVRLEDRIQVRSLTSDGDRFVVDALAGGDGDAACCPTTKTRYVVAFADGRLTVESQQTGHVGMADLAENAWRLERLSADDVVPEGVEVTFQVTPDGGISGSSGCNAFTGQVTSDPERKSFEVGVLATTRRMCPPDVMAVEDRFLELMGIVASYSWQQGQLMLTYVEPEFNAMYFDATDGPAPNGDAGGA